MINWTLVADIAPELAAVPVAQQTLILEDCYRTLSAGVCGDRLDSMACYLAAHQATINKRRGLAGAVTGQTVGQVSRTYATAQAAYLDLQATSYGQTLERLIRTNPASRWVVA